MRFLDKTQQPPPKMDERVKEIAMRLHKQPKPKG